MSRINLSGRKRITRSRVSAVGTGLPDSPRVVVGCDLSGMDLDPDAAVFIEFYRRSTLVRRAAGTVGNPRDVVEDFGEFGNPNGVLLRVRAVDVAPDPTRRGRLLASAERLPIEWDDPTGVAQSLLAFRRADEVWDRLWRLELNDSPTVAINGEIDGWQAFARSEPFVTLVYPEVVRQVAVWVVDQPDDSELARDWAVFLEQLVGSPRPEPGDEVDDIDAWADQAAEAFARTHDVLARGRAVASAEDET